MCYCGLCSVRKVFGYKIDHKLNCREHIEALYLENWLSAAIRRSYFTHVLGSAVVEPFMENKHTIKRRVERIIAFLGFRNDCRKAFKKRKILTFSSHFILLTTLHVKNNLQTKTFSLITLLCHKKMKLFKSLNHEYYDIKFYNILPTHIKSLNRVAFFKTFCYLSHVAT